MEFLDQIGQFFAGILQWFERSITRLFGSSNERRVRQIGFYRERDGKNRVVPGSLIDRINQLEPELEKLSDGELKESASKFRKRLADGQTLDQILPDAFASVREAGKRYLKMRHYDVQMVGGVILHRGMISEMSTGEGKTLVASLPAFLNGLAGHVHVVTVNDYLAQRDMEWMGPLHMGLGLTIGAIQSPMGNDERRIAYSRDITYGTNNEFGFDYLRDNMKPSLRSQVQGALDYAIVDEIDNILIDEARTPLIISGPAEDDLSKYPRALQIARKLEKDVHFEVKEKEHTCHLTDAGVRVAEQLAEVESFYTPGNMEWPHLIDNALRSLYLYKRDVNYIVERGEIIIIDEHTGRKMEGRQWSEGLHQAVEAKEGVKIKQESQTLATITLQNYFKLYKKLSGMTGTAMTEAGEFLKIYNLDVVAVPTNRAMQRINYDDAIYSSVRGKWKAVVQEVKEVHETGRPVLVGTVSIENSETLSHLLKQNGVKHDVLNAKQHEREAEIVAQAGRKGAVTIATNMAGRGTDIILGGNPEYLAWDELRNEYASRLDVPKHVWDEITHRIAEREGMAAEGREVAQLGGLHVIGTERHDSRRIDLQLRGRAARQGDPGSSRFFLSLEDDLMRKMLGEKIQDWMRMIGMTEDDRIESRIISSQIQGAQKKMEERHFDMRKNLLDYDEVMSEQRQRVYSYRQAILEGNDCRELILEMFRNQINAGPVKFYQPNYRWESAAAWARVALGIEVDPRDLRNRNAEQLIKFLQDECVRQADIQISDQIEENVPRYVEDESERNWQAISRWANTRFGLNTNDRELRKFNQDDLHLYLYERAKEAIDRIDFAPAELFVGEGFARGTVASWMSQQFGIEIAPSELEGMSIESIHQFLYDKVLAAYRQREIAFPVTVGVNRYGRTVDGEVRLNKAELAHWASGRFLSTLTAEQAESLSNGSLLNATYEASEAFLKKGDSILQLDSMLDKVYGGQHDKPRNPAALGEFVDWANREFSNCDEQGTLSADEAITLSRSKLKQRVQSLYDLRYRPELSQTERILILDALDNAWKDQLYYMDHLKSGVGLVGYAQKDPKIEYRREGMRAYEQMWQRLSEQVSSTVMRIESAANPEYLGSLWEITSTTHAAPVDDDEVPVGAAASEQAGRLPGQAETAVEPIRNFGDKVGRNDPCPCGSGKKFKKCHGAN